MGYRVTIADERAAALAVALKDNLKGLAELFAKHRFEESNRGKYDLSDFLVGELREYPRSGDLYRSGQCKTAARIASAAYFLKKLNGWKFSTEVVGGVVRVRRVS